MRKLLILGLLIVFADNNNMAFGSSGKTPKEMGRDFVNSRAKIPLEKVGDVDMVFDIKLGGWDWMYGRYGQTVRDRGIKEKRPFWYVLRSLLTTFNRDEQEKFAALSGISTSDSLALSPCEDAKMLVKDADRLVSLHYYLACINEIDEATMAKHAWYALARANPTITCPFWRRISVDGGKVAFEQIGSPTFAQLLENLKTPGKDGLHYFAPDIDPDCYFFSDDPVIMEKQRNKYGCRIDP